MATHDGSLGRDDVTLSALIDGELAPAESRRALERLAEDAQLQARWARYHVVRAACEGAAQTKLRPDFNERLRTALDQEPTVVAPPARRRRPSGNVGRSALAFAASVTLVTAGGLIALQSQDSGPGGDPMVVVESGAGGTALPEAGLGEYASPMPLTGVNFADEGVGEHRMAVYLARHNEYASAGEMPDLVPYSRFTSYQAASR